MPNWLKLLAILTLMMLGLPAVASAHCEHPGGGDSATAVVESVQDTVVAQNAGEQTADELRTHTRSNHFFEASQLPTQKKLLHRIMLLSGDVSLRLIRWQFDVYWK